MKKIILIVLLLPFIAFAEDESAPEDESGGVIVIKKQSADQACKDYLVEKFPSDYRNKKKAGKFKRQQKSGAPWKTGKNTKKDGSPFFVAIGVDYCGASMGTPDYPNCLMDAAVGAQLQGKKALAATLNKEILNEVKRDLKSSIATGTKPKEIVVGRDKDAPSYEDLSMYEKMKLLITQKLDEAITDETKASVGEDERKLDEELDKILGQKIFSQATESSSQAQIRGMKSVFSSIKSDPGSKRTDICNVLIWSDNLVKMADALATGNYNSLQNLKPGKSFYEQVEKLSDMEKLAQYGAFMTRNDEGEMGVLSWAQAGMFPGSGSMGEEIARTQATERADAAMCQLRNENVQVHTMSNNYSVETQSRDGQGGTLTEYYSERELEESLAARSQCNVQGVDTLYSQVFTHPVGKQDVVVLVRSWSPSSANFAKNMRDTLDRQPGSYSEDDYSNSDIDEMDTGSSMGDDEDDF